MEGKGVVGFEGWGPVNSVDASLSSPRASEDSGPGVGKIHGGDAFKDSEAR